MQFILWTAHQMLWTGLRKTDWWVVCCVFLPFQCVCLVILNLHLWFLFSSLVLAQSAIVLYLGHGSHNSLLTFVSVLISGSEKIHVPYLKLLRFLLQRWAQGFSSFLPFFFLLWPLMTLLPTLRKVILNPLRDSHYSTSSSWVQWPSESSCLPPQGLACLDSHRADGFC